MNDLSDKQPGSQKFAHTEGVEDIDDETGRCQHCGSRSTLVKSVYEDIREL